MGVGVCVCVRGRGKERGSGKGEMEEETGKNGETIVMREGRERERKGDHIYIIYPPNDTINRQ